MLEQDPMKMMQILQLEDDASLTASVVGTEQQGLWFNLHGVTPKA